MDDLGKWILSINLVTLVTVISFGFKILRFFNRMEMKVDLMWEDYQYRMDLYKKSGSSHPHNNELFN